MDFPRARRRTLHVNMTALIDVVFLLLIFFMMTANFVRTDSIELTLPGAEKSAKAPPATLSIRLDRNAALYLDGAPATRSGVSAAVKALLEKHADAPIRVEADREANVEYLVELIDLVHQSGGRNIAVSGWEGSGS